MGIDLSKYLDDRGYPGSNSGVWDGGDTAAILGNVITLQLEETFPDRMLHSLIDPNGIPRRHPDTSKWWGQSDRFSRDQLIPLICAGIRLGKHIAIDEIFQSHRKRKFLTAWNTKGNGAMDMPDKFPDLTLFEVWALWIRYKKPWWARIVLWFLDLETLGGALDWRYHRKDRVCRNHMLVSIVGRKYLPTVTTWLINKINNWDDLIERWAGHCKDTQEYPTDLIFSKWK